MLIVAANKRSDSTSEADYYKDVSKEESKADPPVIISSKKTGGRKGGKPKSNQITIYSFEHTKPIVLCPNCDGENVPNAKFCHICGQKMSIYP